jgi:hypothetical protein
LSRFGTEKPGIELKKTLVSPQYLHTPSLVGPLAISITQKWEHSSAATGAALFSAVFTLAITHPLAFYQLYSRAL